ncbi:monovalent cation/H+ antiporter complex subunit F [Blastococcus sp. CCUG 61487]|uniref:monovalent cation/H+ antiporter complex subunit F n=1 Tax=Blastococcus sp. CCUG 61487 TaxID=1840703 RepID=UPI0010C0D6A1|nr:monovalent cation/H+ antiporter complex subunit F [Blastococcus sp. CCUG 61487]TKJ18121.1 pesticidal protein Cry26Aa [Blastococcus sp. CCUG 61487]
MTFLDAALVVLGLALLVATHRVAAGPTDADRALGVDLGFAIVIAAVAVLAVRLEAPAVLDLVLVATLVGFLSTVAVARLVASRGSS